MAIKTLVTNRKALHNYLIEDKIEAGLVLTGTEIKSLRDGRISLGEAYVRPQEGELWLLNAHIARYEPGSYMSHDPRRERKLLLHRKEITALIRRVAEKGYTLVPLRLYLKKNLAKLEIGLGRGKKLYDKRAAIAERDETRRMDRAIRQRV